MRINPHLTSYKPIDPDEYLNQYQPPDFGVEKSDVSRWYENFEDVDDEDRLLKLFDTNLDEMTAQLYPDLFNSEEWKSPGLNITNYTESTYSEPSYVELPREETLYTPTEQPTSEIDFTKVRRGIDNTNMNIIYSTLKSANLNKAQIAGIMGNIIAESSGNYKALNSSKHWGICQWQDRLKLSGRHESLTNQLQYLLSDISIKGFGKTKSESRNGFTSTYFDLFYSTNDPQQAALAFGQGYERYDTNPNSAETLKRLKLAQQIYNLI